MGTIYRQKGRSIWMLKYYRDGRAIYESSGTDVKDEAKKELRKREGAIADGRAIAPKAARLRFEHAVRSVEHDYTTNGRRSLGNVETRIRLHLMPYFGGRKMTAITTADVRAYTTDRLKAGAKPASVNRELAILKRAFSLAVKDGTLTAKPHIPMLTENNVRTGFFERDQFEAVRKHLPAPWRSVMTFALLTGWRVRSEVLPLTWAQVDPGAAVVRLEAGTTKNSEGRTFPYGRLPELKVVIAAQERVRDELKAKGTICPYVFPDEQGKRLPAFYSDVWREACRLAGCPGKIPHDFRRTAVRNLVRAGVPEKTAMMLTGHKTRSVFDRYDIVDEKDLADAVARLAGQPTEQRRRRGAARQR